MSPAESFPLYFPGDARRPFSSEVATRRFAKVAQLEEGGRVLELGCGPSGPASVVLAQEFGCSVVAADADETMLIHMRDRVRSLGLDGRVDVRRVDLRKPVFREGEFDAILCQGRMFMALPDAFGTLRPLLAHQGRLGITYPVRVGRVTPRAVLEFWERRLGAPLLLPRELLQHLALAGFEPESVESLQDAELDAFYRELEPLLAKASAEQSVWLREEMALHRENNGKATSSYAFAVGRRREPGEKPPATRDRG
ncbi:SAM-dependent methyltransferase [Archangium lansingense]|uniref:Methyltransferase domain-containing protein n=1 Tax=Archangium lansingense TaxID=2995310 RepID=A0ABT4A6Z0_9BACT|nr:methyltransferase domain-containing protein [Archangium lansinium]MCY1077417.1 methyltransferase domain-containing protein [Archangium lansinium]